MYDTTHSIGLCGSFWSPRAKADSKVGHLQQRAAQVMSWNEGIHLGYYKLV
jgi:hypothetical protein